MTEAEWLATEDGNAIFDFLWDKIGWPKLNTRKLGLFAVACSRMKSVTKPRESAAREQMIRVEVAERYVDGKANVEEIRRVWPLRYYQDPTAATTWPEDILAWAGSYRACEVNPSLAEKATFFRCLFGNPFRPVSVNLSWLTSDVAALATGIYADRAFDRMPILADALQDAGCDNADILKHCRGGDPHVRGCWVVDLLLGKA